MYILHIYDMSKVADQPDLEEHPKGADQPDREEHPKGADQPDREEHPKGADQPDLEEHPKGADQPDREEHPKGADHPDREEHPKGADQPDREEHPKGAHRHPIGKVSYTLAVYMCCVCICVMDIYDMSQDWEGHPKEGWEGHPKQQPSTSLERPSTSLERPSTSVERPSTSVERPSTSLERGGHLVGKVSCVVCVYRVVCVVPRCIQCGVCCAEVYTCVVCVCVPRCIHVWCVCTEVYTCVVYVCDGCMLLCPRTGRGIPRRATSLERGGHPLGQVSCTGCMNTCVCSV